MKILVTGGAGYIGGVVVAELVKAGHIVTVLDNLSTGHRGNIPEGVDLIRTDIRDSRLLNYPFTFDVICHLAAKTIVSESLEHPATWFGANVAGGLNLLGLMLGLNCHRIIFSSSSSIYGLPEKTPITEDMRANPLSPYAESKIMFEQMLPWYAKAYGIEYVSLRYFNVAGASGKLRDRDNSHIIPAFISAIQLRNKPILHKTSYPTPDGFPIKDYVHVRDVARAHLSALGSWSTAKNRAYNICTGMGFSVKEVYDTVSKLMGANPGYDVAPERPGDTPLMIGSNAMAKQYMGWEPEYHLEDMIQSQMEAMRANGN